MKTFYNVVNAIICCAKEARALIVLDIAWVQFVLQNCENCRIIGLNRAKKNKILSQVCMIKRGPHSTAFTWDVIRKSMFQRLVYTPPDSPPRFTCKVNLSNTKNPVWFFILASLLDRGIQRVNWLPPRTIAARVFLKIIFRGYPIIHGLSNGATANANTIHE